MSEPIPESIPTSSDPHSKRPTKRRALTPTSSQAASLTALFAKPDRPIPLPPSSATSTLSRSHAPPEIVANVQGSSAGAGSGEFHVYKASRRREYERLRIMDEDVKREREEEEFLRRGEQLKRKDEAKTKKNKARREKMKSKKGLKGGVGGAGLGSGGAEEGDGGGHEMGVDGAEGAGSMQGPVKNADEVGVIIHDDD